MKDHRTLKLPATSRAQGYDGGMWTDLTLQGPDGITRSLKVVASWGGGWDHVSISLQKGSEKRTPNWNEMEAVRRAFFFPHETAVQIHPPLDAYINVHPGVLHLWRKQDSEHPLPPEICI